MKITLEGVQETLLIPLAARAFETKAENHRIYDQRAVEIMEQIDYNFEKYRNKMSQEGVIARTIILDREVQKLLDAGQETVCISIGCGLDTRYDRLKHGRIHWYNVDFPEVMELRAKLLQEDENIHLIGMSALNPHWAEEIRRAESGCSRKTIIIIEGMLMYLKQQEVEQLFDIIRKNFQGSVVLAEIMHPFIAKCSGLHDTVKYTNAVFQWGISSGKSMEKLCGGLHFEEEWNLFDELRDRSVLFKIFSVIPFIRNKNNKIVRLEVE